MIFMTASMYSQNYEIYTGAVISEDKDMHSNYMLGLNFTVDINKDRDYLNTLILGFEHGAYMSNEKTYNSESNTTSEVETSCNCSAESLGLGAGNGFKLKKEVRTVSLNFGVGVCDTCWLKRLYLMSGITNSQHITKVNDEKVSNYYSTHIDAGLKYFIKINKNYISPMIKFNPETVSFGIGYSR